MTKTSQPYAPGGTQYWTINAYDGSGRTVSTQSPDGSSTTTYSYLANTVTVTDPAGKWKKFTMDAFGNLISVVEPDPTYTQVTTNYSYDMLNHLTQVSMPRGGNTQTRSFNYTYSNNAVVPYLLSSTNPETGTVSYTYDVNGVLLTKTDAKGQQFTYTYDGYKRPYQISVGGNVIRTFYYDSNSFDSTFSQNALGRLTAVLHAPFVAVPGTPQISHQFVEMYSYSQAGQPTKKRLQANENVYYDQTHNHTGTINLDATYAYDNEGKMTSVNYPTTYAVDQDENLIPAAGPTYTYSFDEMHRPKILTDQNNAQVVNGVTYGAANQLLTMSYFGVGETRTYNNMLQMTRLNIPGQVDITYTFPSATTNNGKITSQIDNISSETVTYQYDSLNRLSAANGSGWNQNFGYDGFGNLVSKTGTNSPALSVAIDALTNHVVGQSYDFNGNQTSTPTLGATLSYDPENRLLAAPGVQYAYDVQNKRIWKGMFDSGGNLTGQELYFYGVDGQKLGTYTLMSDYGQNRQTVLWDPTPTLAVFFGGKRVAVGGVAFVPDRLGSKGKYYPYGEERNSPPLANDQVKFATYTRDSATGLDYADQRYYANNFGRFMTADPYQASGGPIDPGSWNRYSYVQGDPVNYDDRSGLQRANLDDQFNQCFFGTPMLADEEVWMSYCMKGPARNTGGVRPDAGAGGGGGGGGLAGVGLTTAKAEIQMAVAFGTLSKECNDAIGDAMARTGSSMVNLKITAGTLTFVDSTGISGFFTLAQITGKTGDPWNITVSAFAAAGVANSPNASALTLTEQDKNVNVTAWLPYVILTSNWSTDQNQGNVLIHEALHYATGMDDVTLAKLLGAVPQDQNPGTNDASAAIANWLSNNCGHPK